MRKKGLHEVKYAVYDLGKHEHCIVMPKNPFFTQKYQKIVIFSDKIQSYKEEPFLLPNDLLEINDLWYCVERTTR